MRLGTGTGTRSLHGRAACLKALGRLNVLSPNAQCLPCPGFPYDMFWNLFFCQPPPSSLQMEMTASYTRKRACASSCCAACSCLRTSRRSITLVTPTYLILLFENVVASGKVLDLTLLALVHLAAASVVVQGIAHGPEGIAHRPLVVRKRFPILGVSLFLRGNFPAARKERERRGEQNVPERGEGRRHLFDGQRKSPHRQ